MVPAKPVTPSAAYASEAEPPLLHITTLTTAPDGFSWHHNSANIECVSARISQGVLSYIAKKFHSQLFGGGEEV